MDYQDIEKIIALKNHMFHLNIGSRHAGKYYCELLLGISDVVDSGYSHRFGYIDKLGDHGKLLFSKLVDNGDITKLTNGKWNSVCYYNNSWWFEKIDKKGNKKRSKEPFAVVI